MSSGRPAVPPASGSWIPGWWRSRASSPGARRPGGIGPRASSPCPEKTAKTSLAPPPPDGQPYYLAAKVAYQDADYWRASELVRRAVELEEGRPEFHYLLGLALGKNPNWQHQSRESLERAIDLDAWKPQYLDALGELFDRAGMTQRAGRMHAQASAIR